MRTLTIIALVMCHNQFTKSVPMFEFITTPLTDIASSVANSWVRVVDTIKERIYKNFVQPYPKRVEDFQIRTATTPMPDSFIRDIVIKTSATEMAPILDPKIESHIVLTNDGYLLTLHRIEPTFANQFNRTRRTVLLFHGLLGSSMDWIVPGPEKSLPYLLSDGGYEVWLANARGNRYSRNHYTLNVDSKNFWDFSWQEVGEYDLPAIIDYIRRTNTSSETIDFVGHSMGATALMVLLSTKPQYNKHLRIGILLAPLVFMSNVKGPLKSLAALASNPPRDLMKVIGHNEFFPFNHIPDLLASQYCDEQKMFCSNPLFFLSGGIPRNGRWDPTLVSRILHYVAAGGSTKTILHYAEIVRSQRFHRYGNVSLEFPLKQVTLPIVLFSSGGDWLAPITDVLNLYFSISNPIAYYVVQEKNLTHTEFVWGPDTQALVFNKVIDFLENSAKLKDVKNNDVNSEPMIF